jgi:hypothetical protein
MRWFSKKQKLVETPKEEMSCRCGCPYPPPAIYRNEGFSQKKIIKQYIKRCKMCDRVNVYQG